MTATTEPSSDRLIPKVSLSREEAAWSAGVSVPTIDRWISQGKLDYSKIGANVMIEPDVLAEFVRSQRTRRNAD